MIFVDCGRMGTSPSAIGTFLEFGDVRFADEVYSFFGLSMPVVLRAVEDEKRLSAVGVKRYRFVRPCYLHGIMDGDALKDEKFTGK